MAIRNSLKMPLGLFLLLIFSSVAVAQNDKKMAYGILVDNTGSLITQFSEVTTLGKGIVKHIHENGSISLFSFTTQSNKKERLAVVKLGVESSEDRNILDNYIDNLEIQAGETTLNDAIYSIAEALNAKVNLNGDVFAGKAIILITDGADRVSKVKEKQLLQTLKESGIKVYAIGLLKELEDRAVIGEPWRKSERAKAEVFLKKITKETGGRVILPQSNKTDIDSLVKELLGG